MRHARKPFLAALAALCLTAPVFAQSIPEREGRAQEVEVLLEELAQPGLATWEAVENKIISLWSRSGSDTADLMLDRGQEATEAENYVTAIEHLTALTDHAPDFAEGWYARATAWFLMEEYGLAMSDLRQTLALNPDHFGALSGMGFVLEQLGEYEAAVEALTLAQVINPNSDTIIDGLTRMRHYIGDSTL